jgi:hypothetical protein
MSLIGKTQLGKPMVFTKNADGIPAASRFMRSSVAVTNVRFIRCPRA